MNFSIQTFPVYPLGCNCSILSCNETKEAIVIDPGGEEEKIFQNLKKLGLTLRYIIHTHAHFDHCLGTGGLHTKAEKDCKVGLHKDDLFLYEKLAMQCSLFGIPYRSKTEKAIDFYLEDGDSINWGNNSLKILHTPGHTPGSVCFTVSSSEKQITFSGDTLFAGGIGRTDLWGGDYGLIMNSIKHRLLKQDDETILIPGHGETSTIYKEKRSNPFLI
ncbi:MAG: MBL fold metallo-hydrolase [Leptospiraceae bacterium]|nr:MBL fold metallo-hydrolase [Leptospiraceae bacterium]MCP5498413.1 MBL fold metallo-hydrolase [Leptospiraceae bacterium]